MKSLQDQQRVWLANKLKNAPRGTKVSLASHLGIRPDAVSRIVGDKETREIKLDDLVGMAEFFDEEPPGLAAMRKARAETSAASSQKIVTVPIYDSVPAGKLKQPITQLSIEDIPLLAFSDLGRGDWIALTVDGDSMDRLAPDGARIILNRSDTTLVSGKPYVFSDRGEVGFKLWRSDPPRWAPFSTNHVHEARFVKSKRDAERMVVGRVKRSVLDF